MASKNKHIFHYEGRFDPAGVLKGLRDIQQKINKIGINTDLSKSLTKEFSSIEKRLLNLQTKKSMGFSSIAQMDAFEREVVEFQERLKNLSFEVTNLKLNFKDIRISDELNTKLENLSATLKTAKENLKALQDAGALKLSNVFEKLNSNMNVKNKDFLDLQTAIEEKDLIKIQTIMNNIRKNSDIEIIKDSAVREASAALRAANEEVEKLSNNVDVVADQGLVQALEKATALKEQLFDAANLKLGDLYTKSSDYTTPVAKADENNSKAEENLVKARQAVDAWREAQEAVNEVLEQNKADLADAQKKQAAAEEALTTIKEQREAYETIQAITHVLTGDMDKLTVTQKKNLSPIIEWIQKLEEASIKIKTIEEDMEDTREEAMGIAKTSLNKVVSKLEETGHASDEVSGKMKELREESEDLARKENFFGQLTNYIGMVFSLSDAFGYANRAIRYTFQTIKELDAAFTEISVVTDLSSRELWNSFDSYNAMAQQLGITTKDAIETSALYYQQGLDTADVMELTAETVKMARIANMDYAEATDRKL